VCYWAVAEVALGGLSVRVTRFVALAASLVTVLGLAVAAPAAAAVRSEGAAAPDGVGVSAADAAPVKRMPSDVPSKRTPWVLDGEVTKVVQVGDTMVAAGLFTTVSDPMNGPQYPRADIFAFDKATGLVSQTFAPTLNGQVQQLLPGPTPDTVYVAGDFSKVNGKGPAHIALLNVNTGATVTSFKAPTTNGGIETIELLPNNRLFIGGFFTKIGGVAHGQLATLNATTGALDPYLDITVAGHHNTGTGAKAPVGPRESAVSPAGDRLMVVGNFKTAAGLTRDQIVMVNLDELSASVSTTWATTLYSPICSPNAFDSYMRDVEMSPDGSFFVVATTGGPHSGTLCDSAVRWETYAAGTTLSPTWVGNSGGDTLWGVGITDSAVYIGGHDRWMNNPNGSDRAAQGAVPRPGLSALDPLTGVPLKWNPGRNPRGEAAYDIYPVADGIYVVSDTDWIGDRRYQRPRLAFFPDDSGYNVASTTAGSLPGNLYIASPVSNTNVLYRVNAGGALVAATDGGPDWVSDNAATSPYHNTGSSTVALSALTAASLVGVPASTPLGIWTSERNDPTGGNEMQWAFPVSAGTNTQVHLFFASRSTATRRFNVLIDGATVLSNYDPNVDPGVNKGTMKSFDITSDGTVNIDFTHVTGNPQLNAVEIVNSTATVPNNATAANVVTYDGTTITSQGLVTTSNVDWTNVRGAFMVGHSLFYGATDSMLYKRAFDGTSFGDPTTVNPYHDPLWSTVDTGSGQTYDGVTPTWYSQLGSLTGMFYWNGRLYYTLSGQNSLFWRYFVPDSGIVNPIQNTVTGGNVTWSATRGMFLDGSNLYVVSGSDGSLSRIPFVNGAPTGTSTVVNSAATGGIDWRGRALFLASVLPNVAPSASFTPTCDGVACAFDSSASSDSDGTIASYTWDFGDGQGSGEASPTHDYLASGTYTVTLTITDDQDAVGTFTQQVSVVKPNDPPTPAFTVDCTYLDCGLDGSTSTDPDGTINGYDWSYSDGGSDTGVTANHTFAAPGTYDVTLTATDDDLATQAVTRSVTVTGAPADSTVSFVGSTVNQGNVTTPNTTVPAAASTGDRLLMFLTLNANDRVLSDPAGVTGWTVLDSTTTSGMATTIYTKLASPGDAGKKTTVTLNTAAKYTMTIADYAGARPGAVTALTAAETASQADHATPAVVAPAGAWVASYWADKSSATTGFMLPGSVTPRASLCGSSSGHICSSLADTGAAAPTGAYAGLTAHADSASANATMASVILRTQEPNAAPTAEFTQTCTSAACTFDASPSTDTDGSIVGYSWDIAGESASGLSPSHDFLVTGSYDVTLVVTDDEGSTGTVTKTVSVVRTNTPPSPAFTVSCHYLACSFDGSGSGDPDGSIASYAWDFGDGGSDITTAPDHTFGSGGDYMVQLTVTDNDGDSTSLTRTVTAVAARAIAFAGSTVNAGNVATPNTTVPSATSAGDRLVMVLTLNASNKVLSDPTGVTGWNQLDSVTSGTMASYVFTKVAAGTDAGKKTVVPIDTAAKYTMTIATYSGDMLPPQLDKTAETVQRTDHTTPTVLAADGDWALSYWADKSSATTGFTLPGAVTSRSALCGTSSGRICSVLADSSAPVPAGPYGGLVATADSPQASATMWTILLRQDG
jgi:PKD repeat protein